VTPHPNTKLYHMEEQSALASFESYLNELTDNIWVGNRLSRRGEHGILHRTLREAGIVSRTDYTNLTAEVLDSFLRGRLGVPPLKFL